MELYEVAAEYTGYLSQFDCRVSKEHENKYMRKFVGIVLSVNSVCYFAPLSSPKPKHKLIHSNALDVHKIDGGMLGIINLNNMIPVPEACLIKVDIGAIKDMKYKTLLQKQVRAINKQGNRIGQKATKLYNLYKSNNISEALRQRCCNFLLLETKCKNYSYEGNIS